MPHVMGSRELPVLARTSSRVGPRPSRCWATIALVAFVAPAFASLVLASERPFEPILVAGGSADEGGPLYAALKNPEGLAFGPDGRLYVADRDRDRIFAIDLQSRIVEEIAGPAWRKGAPLPALSSTCSMRGVQHVGIEPGGAILFSSHDDAFLCRYDPRGRSFSTVAGKSGKEEFGGDGGLAAQATIRVNGFTCDREGDILIAGANRIRRIARSTGLIQTVAGTGKLGFFGDGGPAIAADLANPTAVAVGRNGTVYFSDSSSRIRAIDRKGTIRTVAGNGRSGPPTDGDATRNPSGEVTALAVDRAGDVVFLNGARRVRRLRASEQRMETLLENHRIFRVEGRRAVVVAGDGTPGRGIPHPGPWRSGATTWSSEKATARSGGSPGSGGSPRSSGRRSRRTA